MALTQEFNDYGKGGNNDDRQDNDEEVVSDRRNVPEEITAENKKEDPGDSPDDIEGNETLVGHLSDAGDKGRKGPDDGNKPGKDDRFSAVFLVEAMGAVEMFPVQETGILPGEDLRAHGMAYPVVKGIPCDGRKAERSGQPTHIQGPDCDEGSRGKQEGISWKEGSDYKARFAEDDDEKDRIGPDSVGPDDPVEVLVEV